MKAQKKSSTILPLILSLLLLTFLRPTECWHEVGHFATAYIAQQYLIERNYEAYKWAVDLLVPLTHLCGENLYPFVECATWMDKVREAGWNTQFQHHFVSNYWFDEGAQERYMTPNLFANATFAIQDAMNTLSSNTVDAFGSSKAIFGKSISLRVLVHIMGDIHQPLHNSERITPGRPDGDWGGNAFKIDHYSNPQQNNLHFIWDEMFRPLSETIRTNLPTEKYLLVKQRAEDIMGEHSLESLLPQIEQNASIESWSQEGYDLATNFVYKGLKEGTKLSEDYQKEAEAICRKRVALGGYRLGMLLDKVYKQLGKPVSS